MDGDLTMARPDPGAGVELGGGGGGPLPSLAGRSAVSASEAGSSTIDSS